VASVLQLEVRNEFVRGKDPALYFRPSMTSQSPATSLEPDFGDLEWLPRKELRPRVKDSAVQALLDEFRVFAYYGPVLADVDSRVAQAGRQKSSSDSMCRSSL